MNAYHEPKRALTCCGVNNLKVIKMKVMSNPEKKLSHHVCFILFPHLGLCHVIFQKRFPIILKSLRSGKGRLLLFLVHDGKQDDGD